MAGGSPRNHISPDSSAVRLWGYRSTEPAADAYVEGLHMTKLDGKIAVITGGNDGMGLATARRFVAEGATVVVTGRRQDVLDKAVAEIGGTIESVQGDISRLDDLDRLRKHVEERHGRVDVLFANAGMAILNPIGEVSEETFDKIIGVNLKGTFFTIQKLLPLVSDGGSIIMTGSIAGYKGFPAFSVYSAAKAGVRSLARTLTSDLKERKIRVNTIVPGTFVTKAVRDAMPTAEQLEGFLAFQGSQTPLGRVGEVDEIATVALFLASSDSSYVTGVELAVDGGFAQI